MSFLLENNTLRNNMLRATLTLAFAAFLIFGSVSVEARNLKRYPNLPCAFKDVKENDESKANKQAKADNKTILRYRCDVNCAADAGDDCAHDTSCCERAAKKEYNCGTFLRFKDDDFVRYCNNTWNDGTYKEGIKYWGKPDFQAPKAAAPTATVPANSNTLE